MELKRYRWLSKQEPCPWNLTDQEIEEGWHFCCFYGYGFYGYELMGPEIPSHMCKCKDTGRAARLIRKVWQGFEPLRSDADGWETQIGVDQNGRCFKRNRDNAKKTHIWQNWEYIGNLAEFSVQKEIAKCTELDLKDFQWQIERSED